MKLAILTGGGDCPGLNAVIRAVVKTVQNEHGGDVVGVRNGFEGFLQRGDAGFVRLTRASVAGLLPRGGTILGASNRCDIFAVPRARGAAIDESPRVARALAHLRADALVLVGGEGTQKAGLRLARQGVPVVGVPKTIDNDLAGTDLTFGFDTAVHVVADALDRLHTTAESHHRVMCVEVMGRHAGWIALHGGLAGGADVILVPEVPMAIEDVADHVSARHKGGKDFSIVVVAEGYGLTRRSGERDAPAVQELDEYGYARLGGAARVVADEVERLTGFDTRVTVLGHVQRGGTPTARDRFLATRLGLLAAELADRSAWGRMAAVRGNEIVDVPLADAVAARRDVPRAWIEAGRVVA